MAAPAAKMAIAQAQEVSRSMIQIVNQSANYQDSKRIAAENGGRLVTLKEFITALKTDSTLFDRSRRNWYWLGDEPGLKLSGYCKIDYENGTIASISEKKWNALPLEEKAYAYEGNGPLALYIDYYGRGVRRLDVDANDVPANVATRVTFVAFEEGALKNGVQSSVPAHLLRKHKGPGRRAEKASET
jgi:hypothetical protein